MSEILTVRDGDRIAYSVIDWCHRAEPRQMHNAFKSWLTSEPMTRLLSQFDRFLPACGVTELLARADELSAELFDYRKGGERWEAVKIELPAEVTAAASDLIRSLYRSPISAAPLELGAFEHVLVLGGKLTGCLLRSELYQRLLDDGLRAGTTWGLGSRRPALDDENLLARQLSMPEVEDELDAMAAALCFSTGHPYAERPAMRHPSETRSLWAGPPPAYGLAAEPGPGRLRANTRDTYRYFLKQSSVSATDRLLIVTSAIHAPFQHAQALGDLGVPTGAEITTVGAHIGTARTPGVAKVWTTAEWLQELRSTLTSMRRAYEKLVDANPDANLD